MVAENEAIPVIFIPLHGQCQYGVAVEFGDLTNLYELTQISHVLKTEVLCKVQAVLLDRVYAACPIESLR